MGQVTTSNQYIVGECSWNLISQDTVNNTSTIYVELRLSRTNDNRTYGAGSFWVGIDDQRMEASSTFDITLNSNTLMASGTFVIGHNSDGNKDITVRCGGTTNVFDINEYSESASLPQIARVSGVSVSADSVILGNSVSVNVQSDSDEFTHDISCTLLNTGYDFSIAQNVTDSCTFTPAIDIANHITESTQTQATITCITYSNGTEIGRSYCDITIVVPDSLVPTLSASNVVLSDCNTVDNQTYYRKFGAYLQNHSRLQAKINAVTTSYSSPIVSYSITINGKTYSSNTNEVKATKVLSISGNNTVSISVTDGRGRSCTVTKSISVVEYIKPKINSYSISRCDVDGTSNDEGEYIYLIASASISPISVSGDNKNGRTISLRYKDVQSTTYITAYHDYSTYTYSYEGVVEDDNGAPIVFDGNKSYDTNFVVTDSLYTVTSQLQLSTAYTLVDYNGSGKGIAFGEVSTEDNFSVNMDANFKKSVTMTNQAAEIPVGVVGTNHPDDHELMLLYEGSNNLAAYVDRTKLGYVSLESGGSTPVTIDDALSTTSTNPVQNKVVTSKLNQLNDDKVEKIAGKGLSSNDFTTTYKDKLDGIADNANKYVHPSYTSKSSGLYKIAVDATGHVSGTTAVSKSDITALGIPGSDTNTWRGIQDNLTSASTTESLSANQGKVLKSYIDERSVNQTLVAGSNLNNITTPGFYNAGGGNNIVNRPSEVTDAFGLIVIHTASGGYYTQICYEYGTTNSYRRNCSAGTWSNWKFENISNTTYSAGTGIVLSGTTFSLASHNHTKSQITDFPTSMPASDVSAWAKASTKPTYTANEVGALPSSGGTLSGSLNLANGMWNKVGDDVAIGDHNNAGSLGIKGLNGHTKITMLPYSGSTSTTLLADGAGNLAISGTTTGTFKGNLTGNVTGNTSGSAGSCTGNAATATKATNDGDGNKITSSYAASITAAGKTVKLISKAGDELAVITTQDTWRGVQNNLTSTSTSDSLSAAQGKALNEKIALCKLKKDKYIFISDSFGTGVNGTGTNTVPWITRVASYLGLTSGTDYWSNAVNGASFFNSGNSFLSALKALSISDKNAITHIIVLGGYNEIGGTTSAVDIAIGTFMTYCKSTYPNATVHISFAAWTKDNTKWDLLNQRIDIYTKCGKYGAAYIPNMQYVMHNYSNVVAANSQGDIAHPNQTGQDTIASYIAGYLKNGSVDVQYPLVTKNMDTSNSGRGNFETMLDNNTVTVKLTNYYDTNKTITTGSKAPWQLGWIDFGDLGLPYAIGDALTASDALASGCTPTASTSVWLTYNGGTVKTFTGDVTISNGHLYARIPDGTSINFTSTSIAVTLLGFSLSMPTRFC